MKKKIIMGVLIIVCVVSFIACNQKKNVSVIEKVRAVSVIKTKEEMYPVTLGYVGVIDSKDTIKYSFKSAGNLKKVYVKTGQDIKKGDKLLELDKKDLLYALKGAEGQMNAAKSQYNKALKGATDEEKKQVIADVDTANKAYKLMKETYENFKKMYEEGGISEHKLKEIKLKFDQAKNTKDKANEALQQVNLGVRDEDVESARQNYEATKANYSVRKSLYNDAVLYAKENGKVLKTLYKEGELVPQGYPVIAIRSNVQIVNIGLSQKDLLKVSNGMKVEIKVDDKIATGEIISIDEVPDTATRTYKTEVKINNCNFHIGSIASVKIEIGKEKGIWIPMETVLSNGVDYVYVVNNGRTFKKVITLEEIYNDKVKVSGLNGDDNVVSRGYKNLYDGLKVNVMNEEGVN